MKFILKKQYVFTTLLICSISFLYSQSDQNLKSFLIKDWVSAAQLDFDTIPYTSDTLKLADKGAMFLVISQFESPVNGTWEYNPEKKQIVLFSKENKTSPLSIYTILHQTDSTLTLDNSSLYPSEYIFVEKGSGIKLPDPTLGYKPNDNVLKHIDYNERSHQSGNGAGASRGIGLIYLLGDDDPKKIEVLKRKEDRQTWHISNVSEKDGDTFYNVVLAEDFNNNNGLELPANIKGSFIIKDSYAELEIPELENLKIRYE